MHGIVMPADLPTNPFQAKNAGEPSAPHASPAGAGNFFWNNSKKNVTN